MKIKRIVALLLGASLLAGICACNQGAESSNDTQANAVTEKTEDITQESKGDEPVDEKNKTQLIVYYPNWNLNSKAPEEGGEVGGIAWESVTMVNHAFFAPYPADGTTESSWDRRDAGLEARTQFQCISTNPEADFEDTKKSAYNEAARNHFSQYAIYAEKYPDVTIMISVGGWSRSGYFSEMCYTAEGRASFIASCVELLKEYPFIGGIDLDWEYPAGSKDGERVAENKDDDQGCPIWGTAAEDNANFTLLLKELRSTLDREFGVGEKLITACASSSTGWTLPCEDWESFAEQLDYVNIMTYDLAGKWAGVTGHHSPADLTRKAVEYFLDLDIDPAKLNIGTPLYSMWFKLAENTMPDSLVGAPIDIAVDMTSEVTDTAHSLQFEKECVTGYTYYKENGKYVMGEPFDYSENGTKRGWHAQFDEQAGAAYLYNDDPESPYYMWFVTYENPLSLQKKKDLIQEYGLAGIIAWESSQDTKDHILLGDWGCGDSKKFLN